MIVPTSIYAPGTLVETAPADADGASTGAPPRTGQPSGPGARPDAGYPPPPPPPPDPGTSQATSPGHEPPPAPDPGYDASAHRSANPPGEHPYGDYAYVIREEEAPRLARPGRAPALRARTTRESAAAEPTAAYGPDDPGYGPPSPDWYTSEDQDEQEAAEELQPVRGVFEPLPNQGGPGLEPPDDTPPLEQIKRFYLTAEANSAENLDRQFDGLLERQRQLISAYFTETALQEDPR